MTPVKLLAALLIALTAAGAYAQGASRQPLGLDRIVAIVNDEVVTRVDLADQLRVAVDSLKRQGTSPPARDALEKQVLERIINQRVQMQFARDTGLKIDDGQLDKAVARIADDNKLTMAGLRAALEKDGVSFARFREEIRAEMLIARLREREVDSRIVITEPEVDAALQNQAAAQGRNEEYNLAHILVRVPEQASPEQIRSRQARAEEALAKARAGEDFRQISASYSDAPEALQGGMLGWREAGRLPTLFLEGVKGLKAGEVTSLLRSSNGFHILKVLDVRGATAGLMVKQSLVRHIVIRTNEIISESEARNRLLGLRERIENGADFAELARLNSQDGAAAKGGDLGWVSPGDTVPEFERAMNQLQPKQMSQPVRTEFGWHLIQVLDRRDEDMSRDRQRMMVRQALRAAKSDEAYQEWVRQLRDKAYVEFRLEER